MESVCRRNQIKVKFDTGDFFIVIFNRKSTTDITTQKTTQKVSLTDLENKIIKSIDKNSRISQKQIAQDLTLSINTVREYIKKLKKKNVLKRIGPDRGGYWKVVRQ